MAGVAAVVGNSHKAFAPEIIFRLARGTSQIAAIQPASFPCSASLRQRAQTTPLGPDLGRRPLRPLVS